ncbi:MAG TPA: T9SS type A sorting domain-containing protein [Saprospiraceae bacterium]|nr:T9SS type A sorting domain-containing protein [Saprospiraceae bacterium]
MMKYLNITAVVAILVTIATPLFAQNCLPGGLTLTTQAEVNSFPVNHPGCTAITGNVVIQGAAITNLAPLANLRQIDGDLLISNCSALPNLNGLHRLNLVGGTVRIQNNEALQALGLDSLRSVRGDFMYISNSPRLQSLSTLNRLDSIAGIFQIWECDSLTTLTGLNSLQFVGATLAVFRNDKLLNINGLNAINRIGDALRIYENPVLNNISALHHPVSIGGALVFTDNPQLSACAVSAVCSYLAAPPSFSAFSGNGAACNSATTILAACATSTSSAAYLDGLEVFPNPTDGMVWIKWPAATLKTARLTDLWGRTLWQTSAPAPSVDISSFSAGIYILEISTDSGNAAIKLIRK